MVEDQTTQEIVVDLARATCHTAHLVEKCKVTHRAVLSGFSHRVILRARVQARFLVRDHTGRRRRRRRRRQSSGCWTLQRRLHCRQDFSWRRGRWNRRWFDRFGDRRRLFLGNRGGRSDTASRNGRKSHRNQAAAAAASASHVCSVRKKLTKLL